MAGPRTIADGREKNLLGEEAFNLRRDFVVVRTQTRKLVGECNFPVILELQSVPS